MLGAKFAGSDPVRGVFISHSRLKEKARAVARALEASNVDYYFDENDEELQLADEQNDHLKVVRCIENEIKVCSHLLGIVRKSTRESWWVPYEIGSATGHRRDCAHLNDREVNNCLLTSGRRGPLQTGQTCANGSHPTSRKRPAPSNSPSAWQLRSIIQTSYRPIGPSTT